MNPYKKVFLEFQKAGINYLIVGGVAVNLYGYSRFTGDIDILLMLDADNLGKMGRVMKKLGYVERLPVKLQDLTDRKKVKQWLKEKGMTAYTFISSKKPQLDVDILTQYSTDFKKFYKKKAVIEAWGIIIPVVSLSDLIAMKEKAGRDKDLQDVRALLELKAL